MRQNFLQHEVPEIFCPFWAGKFWPGAQRGTPDFIRPKLWERSPEQGCLIFTDVFHRATKFKFMPDGASVHKAQSTMNHIQNNPIRLFNRGIWPPNSPDMNPIEHLWPMVGKLLTGRVLNNREDLWDGLTDAFSRISP